MAALTIQPPGPAVDRAAGPPAPRPLKRRPARGPAPSAAGAAATASDPARPRPGHSARRGGLRCFGWPARPRRLRGCAPNSPDGPPTDPGPSGWRRCHRPSPSPPAGAPPAGRVGPPPTAAGPQPPGHGAAPPRQRATASPAKTCARALGQGRSGPTPGGLDQGLGRRAGHPHWPTPQAGAGEPVSP